MIWLIATFLGGLLQSWRTAVQARVKKSLSVNAAGLVRYLYGLPVALFLTWFYVGWLGEGWPGLDGDFPLWVVLAGLAQIIGTNLLLMAFGYRNYVTGSAYSKTEAVQGAILAMIMLGEVPSPLTIAGIVVSVAGVLIISSGGARLRLADLKQPAALCGLGAGGLFALTAIFVKLAAFQVSSRDDILRALITLSCVMLCQLILQGSYVVLRERDQLRPIFKSWRVSGQVGVLAALGSGCWNIAFVSAPVALVRSVGQVEVIFTLLFGRFYLKEKLKRSEVIGLLLVGMGVVLAVLGVT